MQKQLGAKKKNGEGGVPLKNPSRGNLRVLTGEGYVGTHGVCQAEE